MFSTEGKKKKNYTFVLKNIDVHEIDNKYGLNITSNLQAKRDEVPQNTTLIDDLTLTKNEYYYPYRNENKYKCVTMFDSLTKGKITTQHCFWCRHPFSSVPIGCPLKYIPNEIIQGYSSEITKEKYTVCQKICKNDIQQIDNDQQNIKINDYFETDGSFCSFNCCLAFIKDNVHNPLYARSQNLLMKMCLDVFEDCDIDIKPSPSWRLLKEYGGFMSIQEFRDSLSNYIYIDNNHHITNIPKILPIGSIFEEQYIF